MTSTGIEINANVIEHTIDSSSSVILKISWNEEHVVSYAFSRWLCERLELLQNMVQFL